MTTGASSSATSLASALRRSPSTTSHADASVSAGTSASRRASSGSRSSWPRSGSSRPGGRSIAPQGTASSRRPRARPSPRSHHPPGRPRGRAHPGHSGLGSRHDRPLGRGFRDTRGRLRDRPEHRRDDAAARRDHPVITRQDGRDSVGDRTTRSRRMEPSSPTSGPARKGALRSSSPASTASGCGR